MAKVPLPLEGPKPFDFNKFAAEVKANRIVLNACVGPHDFQPTKPRVVLSQHVCTKCQGTVSAGDAFWYKHGLLDARKLK